ncbi:MAG: glycosyltransferase family 9 protein [Rhodospirillaceae bacterium]
MRILFITATRIGDAVISTGLLAHLVQTYPNAKLTIACGPLAASLFADVPNLERVIVLAKKPCGQHWFSLWQEVRKVKWDVVVDLRRSLIPYLVQTRQRYRLGPDDDRSHRVQLLSGLFGLSPPADPKIWLSDHHKTEALDIVGGGEPYIALCPIAARPEKTWSSENFTALARAILAEEGRFTDNKILLVGAEADRSILTQMAQALPQERCGMLIGCSDLLTVAAVLAKCQFTIANDSGLAHLSAAVGSSTVALFGPTRADLYRPWGARVTVVQAPNISNGRAMSDISVGEVLDACHAVLT